MITITIYGLDQFVVGRLSREMTPNLAKLYEVSEDEILFVQHLYGKPYFQAQQKEFHLRLLHKA